MRESPLRSIRIPAVEQGRKAGEMLIDLILQKKAVNESAIYIIRNFLSCSTCFGFPITQ